MDVDVEGAQPQSYGNLVDRAYLSLREAGGDLTEDALVARMFGSSSTGPLWPRLLAKVLEGDPRFTRLPNGRWTISPPPSASARLDGLSFVALDLKATGPKPWSDRLLDVAAVRLVAGAPERPEVYAARLNPQRRVPRYVTSATGIRLEDALESSVFEVVADDLLAFLGPGLLVGHGLAVQMAFLQYELRLAGKPALANEMLDTLDLAALLLPDMGKPSLVNLALRLGLRALPKHDALTDARLVGQIVQKLLAVAVEQRYATLDDLRAGLEGRGAGSAFAEASEATRPRLLLDSRRNQEAPSGPGVYVLKDAGGRVLYVGKAANLPERLASYRNRPLGYTRQMEGLVDAVQSVEAEPVDTELEALLLEARLIRQHRPPFNIQRRAHLAPLFLRIDRADPFPRLQASSVLRADGATYFGPFRSSTHLRRTLDLLLSLLPLRTCTRALGRPRKSRQTRPPCTKLGSGACVGPCVGAVSAAEYAQLAERAVELLRGEKAAALEDLRQRLRRAVAAHDTPTEGSLRESIRRLSNFPFEAQMASTSSSFSLWERAVPHPSPLPQGEGAERPPLPEGQGAERPCLPLPVGEGWGEGAMSAGASRPWDRGHLARPRRLSVSQPPLPGHLEEARAGKMPAVPGGNAPAALMVMLYPSADGAGLVVFALGEGVFLGSRRLRYPLDAEALTSFLETCLSQGEATAEQVEEFNLAIRWLTRHADDALVERVHGASSSVSLGEAAAAIAERVLERWSDLETAWLKADEETAQNDEPPAE